MLKKSFLLLLIPIFLFSSEIQKTYTFNISRIKDDVIFIKGCRTSRILFAPKLPTKPINLVLPLGEKATSYYITYNKPIELDGEFVIKPFRPGGRLSTPPPADYYTRRSSVYSTDEYYPSLIKSEKFVTHYKNGIPVFSAVVNPVQYNPVSGKVRLYEKIKVSVHTEKVKNNPVLFFDPCIKSLIQNRVDNPEAVSSIPYTKRPADAYDYLIVTLKILEDKFSEFVEFNKRRGLKSKVVNIEDVLLNSSGSDNAEKLKNFIKKEYNEKTIRFVLLGGDEEYGDARFIPHKGYDSDFNDYGTTYIRDRDVAADMYFQTLDGDGVDDLEWDVYAARFAVDNNTELQRMINKTIMYSEEPVKESAVNVLLLGEKAWENINGGICWGKDEMILLKGECDEYYHTVGFDDNVNIYEMYDKERTWTATDLINKIHNDKITFINHVGHSAVHFIAKLGCKISPHAHNLFEDTFENNGVNGNFFLFYTYGCYQMSFDNRKISYNASVNTGHYSDENDCICEFMTAEMDGGSVAIIANTRFGLGDDGHASPSGTDGSSIRVNRFFHDAVYGQSIHFLAMMTGYSKEINKTEILELDNDKEPYYGQMQYVAYEVNVLGDPALSVWTKIPQELQADHPTSVASNDAQFLWDTKMPYTSIALLDKDGDEIICSQITGVDGKCEITNDSLTEYLSQNVGGKLKINVKAHNYLPYSGEIQIGGIGILDNIEFVFNNNFNLIGKTGKISYSLPASGLVNISVYDSRGALIETVVNEYKGAGNYHATFTSNDLSNGIYYCRISAGNTRLSKKFIVTK